MTYNHQVINKKANNLVLEYRILFIVLGLGMILVLATLVYLLLPISPSIFSSVQEMQTVSFSKSNEYLLNPFMGPVAFARNKSSNFEGTIVVGGFSWADIEKRKGEYDFSKVEEKNNYHYWTDEKDRQFMLGFAMDYPSVSRNVGYDDIDIPLWLYEELKAEAIHTYTQLLQQARAAGNQTQINVYSEALDIVKNDRKVVDDFNIKVTEYDYTIPGPGDRKSAVANIPGVGSFYRYSRDLAGGDVEYRVGFSPNYASPLLIDYHRKVMQAIANRYDHEKTYAIIMGSMGHWGEMHTTYVRGADDVGRYPGIDISFQYEEVYARYFKNTFVSSRYPREVARDNNFGLHNHGFGDPNQTYDWFVNWYTNGYQDYFTKDHHPAMPDFWKTAPSGAEFLYTADYRYLTDSYFDATLKQAKDTYLTWLLELWYDLSPEAEQNMQRLMSKIGYRFAITEASFNASAAAGESIVLTTKWCNTGTAPFYYDWPIMVQLQNSEGTVIAEGVVKDSVRSLFPGNYETYRTYLKIPVAVPPGTYQLWAGIFNPQTRQAAINLAVENVQAQGHMILIGQVEVINLNVISKTLQQLLN